MNRAKSKQKKSPSFSRRAFYVLAERGGFEPPIGVTLRLISSQVHSTTLPPLRLGLFAFAKPRIIALFFCASEGRGRNLVEHPPCGALTKGRGHADDGTVAVAVERAIALHRTTGVRRGHAFAAEHTGQADFLAVARRQLGAAQPIAATTALAAPLLFPSLRRAAWRQVSRAPRWRCCRAQRAPSTDRPDRSGSALRGCVRPTGSDQIRQRPSKSALCRVSDGMSRTRTSAAGVDRP